MNRLKHKVAGLLAVGAMVGVGALAAQGCGEDGASVLPPELGDLPALCGLECAAQGIAEGNFAISGTPSIDAFFGAVVNFGSKSKSVGKGIDVEVRAIKGAFGFDPELAFGAQFNAAAALYLDGDIRVEAEPPKCQVDAQASFEASARCDAEFDAGSAKIACEGSCEADVSAELNCGAEATLNCTVSAPSVLCEGSCSGSCKVELDAEIGATCEGTCRGECDGTCSAGVQVDNGEGGADFECAGECTGTCKGSCEAEVSATAEANCTGECTGECKIEGAAEAQCEGALRAECKANAGASIECSAGCEGEFTPPSAKAECEASASAEASMNVQCTPPRVVIDYKLAVVAEADIAAQAQFVAGIKALQLRLPSLLVELKRARSVAKAGSGLSASASGAVTAALDDIRTSGSLKATVGAVCALTEVPKVAKIVTDATTSLNTSVQAGVEIGTSLGLGNILPNS